jgi:peptide/nickel transport system ATP-binding protein
VTKLSELIAECKNVTKFFESGFIKKTRNYAVMDVSLKIHEGEIIALVGESGSGKTTLGRIIAGLVKPSKGQILWFGKDIWNMEKKEFKSLRPLIQVIHQDPYVSLNPSRTVYQTLMPAIKKYKKLKSKKELKEKTAEVLKYVGITPPEFFLNKYPHHLSGGMKQRLAIARSLIPNPKLIVADEPISMIDVSLRLTVLDLLKRLNDELGTALIYITHDLATAKYFVSKGILAVMYLGRIMEIGPMKEVISNPLHPYLRVMISVSPIPDPKLAKKRIKIELRNVDVAERAQINGCPFSPKCPYAEDICFKELPAIRDFGNDHKVACHQIEVLPKWDFLTY